MKDESKTKMQLIRELNDLRKGISELKGFEEEIKQTKTSYEKFVKAFLQNSIPMAITTLKDEKFIEVSNAFLNLMGWRRDEVIGRTSIELGFTEEQRATFSNELNRRGCIENLEMKVRAKGGALRDGLFNAVLINVNTEMCLLTVMTDITERKQAEDALRKTEGKYRMIVENTNDVICMHDFEGNIIEVNDNACQMLGYNREELVGANIAKFDREWVTSDQNDLAGVDPGKPDNSKAFLVDMDLKRLLKEGTAVFERKNIRKDGSEIVVEVSVKVISYDGKGTVAGFIRDISERKRIEYALRESEERFKLFMDNSPTIAWMKDEQGRHVYLSKAYEDRFGAKLTDWQGKTDFELWPREIAEEFWKNDQIVLNSGQQIDIMEKTLDENGDTSYWWNFKFLFRDERGRKYVGGVGMDVTERKLAEEKLMASEKQFRDLIESVPIGIFTYEGTKFHYLNPACERITGYTREELLQKDFWETIHPAFQETAREYIYKRQKGEPVPERFELKFITKSGEVRWGERSALTIERKENPLVLVMVTDITERKRAEEELKKSEEKYRAVLENASDPILLGDEQGNLKEANKRASEFFGYSREELLQMHFTHLHPIDLVEKNIAIYKEIVTHGKGVFQSGAILRKDGMVIPVDVTAVVITYGGNKLIQASFRDITAHKQIEDELEKRVQERIVELSEKNKLLEEEVTKRKRTAAALQKKEKELMLHARKLEEMNSALKILLKQREEDKNELEEKVMANVNELLLPYLETLKKCRLDNRGKVQVSIIDANLKNIISPFTHRLSSKYSGFTPREIQVANLIRQGKSTKDIAEYVGVSQSAINIYRNNIRSKLGLVSKKINLRSHLMSFS